jgi:hypothetical protein
MARHGSLRASDDDRERTVERLHKAATEGRIAAEELEHRVSTALKAVTYDELDGTVADLPGPRTRRGREPARRTPGRWAVSTVAHNPMLLLFAIPVVAVTAAMVLAATIIWSVLMVVVLVLGGGPRGGLRAGPPPWVYARRQAMRQVRRRPGSHWA